MVIGNSVYQQYGYLAGSDKARAEDINHMLGDSTMIGHEPKMFILPIGEEVVMDAEC